MVSRSGLGGECSKPKHLFEWSMACRLGRCVNFLRYVNAFAIRHKQKPVHTMVVGKVSCCLQDLMLL